MDKLLADTQSIIQKESAKSRMKLLNTLKAAPGQENRAMITHFLMVQKWITHPQTPDDWPVSKMPRNDMELMKLATDIDEFQQRQQREHPEIVP